MTNPIGVHAGCWGFDWTPAAADATIAAAARAGYDLIEIPAIDLAVLDPADTASALHRHGITPAVSLALGEADDITSPDPAVVGRGLHRLLAAVRFAGAIGAGYVGGVTHSAMRRYLAAPTTEGRDRAVRTLRVVAQEASRHGVVVGVEYVNRYESNLLNTAAQARAFVEDVGEENVVVHLDTFHAALEERDLTAGVLDAGELLGYVHASENHRGALGTGSTDWQAFLRALLWAGFRGPITVESFSRDVVGPRSAVDIALWRSQWDDPDVVAAESLTFLRAQLDEARRAPVHH
ncbi:epimerase [Cellulomonas chitinilytica]|uniref:Epimerase n=1 Tax=Cellulomonas chitinilytica TaxID=398759 RepID=A0A919P071_9CELL|nr:sugar phosphate isomerase/epimerase [Cellulomonas chitinilytica]GIG20898.1 epimerase [Cellulomonas chitinilytica]